MEQLEHQHRGFQHASTSGSSLCSLNLLQHGSFLPVESSSFPVCLPLQTIFCTAAFTIQFTHFLVADSNVLAADGCAVERQKVTGDDEM